jgi:hypothetical protein
VLLLATYRADEPASAGRLRRLAEGVRRSGSALVLELGPLDREELAALLAAHADAPPALADAIVARSEGNPFFAEELLPAAGDRDGALPGRLRDLLLQRARPRPWSPPAPPGPRPAGRSMVISVRTAGVHVSHILRKLDAPNRLEAAAIAHRLAGA